MYLCYVTVFLMIILVCSKPNLNIFYIWLHYFQALNSGHLCIQWIFQLKKKIQPFGTNINTYFYILMLSDWHVANDLCPKLTSQAENYEFVILYTCTSLALHKNVSVHAVQLNYLHWQHQEWLNVSLRLDH